MSPESSSADFGAQIRRLRQRAGWTQTRLAEALDLSGNSMISRIESGSVRPSERIIDALAHTFGVERESLTMFLNREDAAPGPAEILRRDANDARARISGAVDGLLADIAGHRDALSTFFAASRLNLVWTLERKLRRESEANEVWVVTPDLKVDLSVPEIHAVVRENVRRGCRYRYLIPDTKRMRKEARRLLAAIPERGEPQIRADHVGFDFAFEMVLYDQGTDAQLGLLVAPTRRPEFDIVLGRAATRNLRRAFRRRWPAASEVCE
ncbi:MAG: helix-turn-helix transcriptional regulator [Gemmatimonadota bacterium]|jgi:transcriptional regulator with XRE-family HTH domain